VIIDAAENQVITLAQRTYTEARRYDSTLTRAYSGVYIANLPGKRLVIVGPSG
jgi:hypothetical protein